MNIKPTTIDELSLIRQLLQSTDITQHTYLRITQENLSDEQIAQWIYKRDLYRYSAYDKTQLVGMIVFEPCGDITNWSILVHPAAQGRGYGRQLAEQSLVLAKQLGFNKIRAEIAEPNPGSTALVTKVIKAREYYFFEKKLPINTDPMSQVLRIPHLSQTLEARPASIHDAVFYRELLNDPTIIYQTYCGTDFKTCSDEELMKFILGKSDERYTLWLLPEHKPIGTIHLYDREGVFSNFGIGIKAEYQHKGFGKTALTLLENAAKLAGIRILRGDVFTDNTPMCKTLQKAGYRPYTNYERYLYQE
jgi:RimJ/RimL family protein N-acetyltransferase